MWLPLQQGDALAACDLTSSLVPLPPPHSVSQAALCSLNYSRRREKKVIGGMLLDIFSFTWLWICFINVRNHIILFHSVIVQRKTESLGALINYIEPHLVTLFVLNVTAVCEAITDSGELQSFLNQRWQMIENGAIHTVCLYLYFSFLLPLISLPSLTCSHSQTHSLPPSCWFMVTVKGHERLA